MEAKQKAIEAIGVLEALRADYCLSWLLKMFEDSFDREELSSVSDLVFGILLQHWFLFTLV